KQPPPFLETPVLFVCGGKWTNLPVARSGGNDRRDVAESSHSGKLKNRSTAPNERSPDKPGSDRFDFEEIRSEP
ncbi:MAG: hypothetical protein ACK4HG_13865, partial [Agrobacterium albertimagni]